MTFDELEYTLMKDAEYNNKRKLVVNKFKEIYNQLDNKRFRLF